MIKYEVNEASIAKMASIYLDLMIDGIDDEDGFNDVHDAKKIMVKHRTSINKLRKSTNKNAQKFIKTNNDNAKKLLVLIEPIESHLKNEEDKITAEKERIQSEIDRLEKIKINNMVTSLFEVGVNIPYSDVSILSDSEYDTMLNDATIKHYFKQSRIREEQEAQKAESKRLAEIQAVQERKEADLKAQLQAIENEKKNAIERQERESFEKKVKEDAIIQAKKDAIESKIKIEKEVRESIERKDIEKKEKEDAEAIEKVRLESLMPDKEKLMQYAKSLTSINCHDVKDRNAYDIVIFAEKELESLSEHIIKLTNEL